MTVGRSFVQSLVAAPVAALAASAGLLIATVGAAQPAAATTATFRLNPTAVHAGGNVHVLGRCEADTTGWAISRAFRNAPGLDFAGVGAVPFMTGPRGGFAVTAHVPARRAEGRYVVSVRCGGGVLSVARTLDVSPRTG